MGEVLQVRDERLKRSGLEWLLQRDVGFQAECGVAAVLPFDRQLRFAHPILHRVGEEDGVGEQHAWIVAETVIESGMM